MSDFNGQSKGGMQRAENLTASERKEISSNAAKVRWEKESLLPKATHRGDLPIGDIIIPCAVLEDGTRILSESGIASAMGSGGNRSGGAIKKKKNTELEGGAPLPVFMNSTRLEPFIDMVFGDEPVMPISYKDGRKIRIGYPATILPKICEVWLKAREAGALQTQQLPKAMQAEILMRALAHIGIVALVDEVTGYQEDRDRDSLHKLLEVYLVDEKLKWAKRFPDEFYKQIYRLMNWKYPKHTSNHPSYLGKLTNQLVYDKLPKGVLDELQVRNPTKEGTGHRKWKHHQFLSEDIGQADLRDHLLQLIAIMRISDEWPSFVINFQKAFPEPGQQLSIDYRF
ncbi:MAG: P63C domain-containing protein [Methylococcaceae bacterium]|jgi:hypothetical protein